MTKKRKRYPDLNQKLERPWCYYCERDFDDLKILISHQKAKHFKCDRCGRRLNTAGGLSVHMNQVHKENLTHVENANPGRQGLDVEIFGMEGVPADIIDQHNQQVTQAHFAEEQERARLTGNPIRGLYANGQQVEGKRARVTESLEDIEKRAEQFREDRKNGVLPTPPVPVAKEAFPPVIANGAIPARPGSIPNQPGALPPRPGFGAAYAPPGQDDAIQASLDDLIAGVQKENAPKKEDEKKSSKKDKNMRLIYNDENVSPEEKMALLPRFAQYVRV